MESVDETITIQPITIRILGNNQRTGGGIERYKEFLCWGRRDATNICSGCTVRFICFTESLQIELEHTYFGKGSVTDISAVTVADTCTPDVKYKVGKDRDNHIKLMVVFDSKQGEE